MDFIKLYKRILDIRYLQKIVVTDKNNPCLNPFTLGQAKAYKLFQIGHEVMSRTLTAKDVHPKLIEILRYFINLNLQ